MKEFFKDVDIHKLRRLAPAALFVAIRIIDHINKELDSGTSQTKNSSSKSNSQHIN